MGFCFLFSRHSQVFQVDKKLKWACSWNFHFPVPKHNLENPSIIKGNHLELKKLYCVPFSWTNNWAMLWENLCNQVRLIPAYKSYRLGILDTATTGVILSRQRTKGMHRLICEVVIMTGLIYWLSVYMWLFWDTHAKCFGAPLWSVLGTLAKCFGAPLWSVLGHWHGFQLL